MSLSLGWRAAGEPCVAARRCRDHGATNQRARPPQRNTGATAFTGQRGADDPGLGEQVDHPKSPPVP